MTDSTKYVLAVDLGTSGPKVAIVGDDGALAGRAARSVKTSRLPPGGAEQDPEELWAAVCSAAKEALDQAGRPRDAVRAIACVSQYSSIVPVDAEGRPTMNLILWMDARGAPYSMALYGEHDMAIPTWIDVHGAAPLPSGADSLSHMLYVKQARPDVYERTHKFLEAMDFLAHRLTGRFTANLGTAFMMLLTDNRSLDPPVYDDELVRMSGLDRDKLPELTAPDAWIGTLSPAVADELGLSPQTRVLSSLNDTQAASIGTATFQSGQGAINIGTTSQVLAHMSQKATDMEAELVTMPSPLPGRYLVVAENGLGGGTLQHFLDRLVFARDELADHSTADPFAGVERAVRAVEAGSGGVLFLPWLTGATSPTSDPNIRGGFINVSLETTRQHLVRAVMEGVALNLRWLLGAVEKFADQSFPDLAFSGGAATSDAWSQILADVLGKPIRQLENARYSNNLAAAFLAFCKLGSVDLGDVSRFIPIKSEYAPTPEHRARYDRCFEQFRAAFERLQPVCGALNS